MRGLISRITGRVSPRRSIRARESVVFPEPMSPTSSARSFSSTAYSSRASASRCWALSYRNAGSGVLPNGRVAKPKNDSYMSVHELARRARLARASAEVVDERADVDDEDDLPFADFRRAGDAGDRLQPLADRLDDDLLLPHERVDEDAGDLLARARDDDEPLRVGRLLARRKAERIREPQQRKREVAQREDFAPLDRADVARIDAQRLFDRRQRNRVLLAACAHDQRLDRSEERRVGKECRSRWSP